MVRTQRWTPDTCANPAMGDSCVFLEEWDDAVDPVARTHTFKSRERVCSRHASIPDGAACFLVNYDENRRKNVSWSIAQSAKATLLMEQMQWSYRADGVLLLSFGAALTTNQKNSVQNACNVQFGAGKVIVS